MEIKEMAVERVVIAKPVASKPRCSTFTSFSDMIAGVMNDDSSPPRACLETAVMMTAIRPRTVRVTMPAANQTVSIAASETGLSLDTLLASDTKSSLVVYKPLAKAVSKSTVSLLANMGNFNTSPKHELPQFMPQIPSKSLAETTEGDANSLELATANVDRPSYDGYNWRKYGQKQMKGSECLRSYYKCTHPNCPVKKKVERSFDGELAEIVYKGEHNHLRPRPMKKNTPTATPRINELRHGSGNQHTKDPIKLSAIRSEDLFGAKSKGIDGEYEEPGSKRRKSDHSGLSMAPKIVMPSPTDTEIVGDRYHWRKYGQKAVKGNPYPRSYYRCTTLKCKVRKHVECRSENPKALVTTYEGKHNHELPTRRASQASKTL